MKDYLTRRNNEIRQELSQLNQLEIGLLGQKAQIEKQLIEIEKSKQKLISHLELIDEALRQIPPVENNDGAEKPG